MSLLQGILNINIIFLHTHAVHNVGGEVLCILFTWYFTKLKVIKIFAFVGHFHYNYEVVRKYYTYRYLLSYYYCCDSNFFFLLKSIEQQNVWKSLIIFFYGEYFKYLQYNTVV